MTRVSLVFALLFTGFVMSESKADDREYLRCIEMKNTIENTATMMFSEWFSGTFPTHPSQAVARGRLFGLHEALMHVAHDVGTTMCDSVRALPTTGEIQKK